jgi:carboxyl-terminal processing protease
MNKRIALGPVIALLCISIVLTAVVTRSVVKRTYNEMLAGLPEQAARYEILDELDDVLRAHYYSSSDNAAMRRAIAQGYVSGLPDGYSRYLTAQELKVYQNEAIGEMRGVGIEYSKTSRGQMLVEDVMDASPAAQAGVKTGDVIVAIDSIPMNASNYDEMAQKLKSDKLSSLTLTVRRGGVEHSLTMPMGFEAASVISDHYEDVGYLKLTAFYATTPAQVKTAVDAFLQSGVRALVIDLRKNNSENVQYAMQTLDVFVPLSDAPAMRLIDQNGGVIDSYMTDAAAVNLPIAVLVSSGTQAAAELFACDLRDFGKASLVGTKTKGLGLVRQLFELSNGDAVLLCVGEMLSYRSDSFHGAGVEPDLRAEADEKASALEKDSQFLEAVSLLRNERDVNEQEETP